MVCIISLTISLIQSPISSLSICFASLPSHPWESNFFHYGGENLLHKFPLSDYLMSKIHTKKIFSVRSSLKYDQEKFYTEREKKFMTPKESRHGSNLKLDALAVYATPREIFSSSNMLIILTKTIVIIKRMKKKFFVLSHFLGYFNTFLSFRWFPSNVFLQNFSLSAVGLIHLLASGIFAIFLFSHMCQRAFTWEKSKTCCL